MVHDLIRSRCQSVRVWVRNAAETSAKCKHCQPVNKKVNTTRPGTSLTAVESPFTWHLVFHMCCSPIPLVFTTAPCSWAVFPVFFPLNQCTQGIHCKPLSTLHPFSSAHVWALSPSSVLVWILMDFWKPYVDLIEYDLVLHTIKCRSKYTSWCITSGQWRCGNTTVKSICVLEPLHVVYILYSGKFLQDLNFAFSRFGQICESLFAKISIRELCICEIVYKLQN